jgi:hypothetical protein
VENIYQNPVVLKVHNGTRRSDINLCSSCRYGFHTKASLSGNELVLCMAVNPAMRVPEPLAECSTYLDRTQPTLHDMQEIAWSLMTDKGGRKLGFLSPEELRKRDGASYGQPASLPGFGA